MGMDMWLPSVFDYGDAAQVERVLAPLERDREAPRVGVAVEDVERRSTEIYDALRATGGYYREAYPWGDLRGQLLGMLGLSWKEICVSLTRPDEMPPAHARRLLAELKRRPVTDAMIEAVAREEERLLTEAEVAAARDGFQRRRRELMALLGLAIDKNEALRLSG
jgi:hypothetical protein